MDYTPDHLPIIGLAVVKDHILNALTVVSAGGAGMTWGPAVARAAADVALAGRSDLVDTSEDLGLLEEATGEPMQAFGVTLWQDGEQEAGVWECTPGPSYSKLETNEFVHVLSGRVTSTPTVASRRSWGPATPPCSPRGWAGHLADPRDNPQGLRALLTTQRTHWLHCF